MTTRPNLLVAADPPEDEAPLIQARTYADDLGATITLAHVVARPKARVLPQLAGRLPSQIDLAASLELAATATMGRAPDAVLVREGDVADEIVHIADELKPLLLVVGRPRRDGTLARVRRALAGSIPLRVAGASRGYVLVAHPSPPASGPVLAITDLRDPSRPAITQAIREATARSARLVVLHVVDAFATTFEALELAKERAKACLAAAVEGSVGDATLLVRTGPVELGIEDALEELEPQLVVVGREEGEKRRVTVRGGPLETVVRLARCSVLVVPLRVPASEREPAR